MDYQKIGFRCGIEIHQQLETDKLFCNCPSIVNDTHEPDVQFTRRLRAVTGETGDIDKAASHEQAKERVVRYEACSTSSCLVEMDEEPPHEMNREALAIALQVAQMLDAKIVDEIQVMRKTVVDGSNVSGFQRTALVATDGHVDTSKGRVKVSPILIEEEAAKKITEDDTSVTYRLDRLGVPLIELGTDASIKDPMHAKETAEKLGMILRSTGKVKRGIGSIRQDVNISIKGGARTEIKGFQDLKSIPKVIDNEISRQQELIDKGERIEPAVRKAEPDGTTSYLRPMPGSARMYPETDVTPIVPEIRELKRVELLEEKAKRFRKDYGLGADLAKALAKSDEADVFEKIAKKAQKLKPSFIAETLISMPKEIRRKENINIQLGPEQYDSLFSMVDAGELTKASIPEAMKEMSQGTFDKENYKSVPEEELRESVKQAVAKLDGKPMGAIMGEVMKKYNGRVDGKRVSQMIKEYM